MPTSSISATTSPVMASWTVTVGGIIPAVRVAGLTIRELGAD